MSEKVELLSRTPEIKPEEIIKGDVLGSGTFGNVWKGICRGKDVAIKELTAELDDKTIKEFTKECEILMMLRHTNIVTFMGACVERDSLAIVTELLSGDLENYIKEYKDKRVPTTHKLKMMRGIAQGMAWLHNSNPQIIHRDLKPKNVLLDVHLNVKICDFGLSLMKSKNENINTRAGSFIWMAPEALLRKPHNEKVDVYSYGIVSWQIMVMNPQPFKKYLEMGSLEAFTDAVCIRGERPPFDDSHPKIIKKLIKKLWDNDPQKRPDFETIITEINNIILELALIDPDARSFWKFSFEAATEVPFESFYTNLCGHLNFDTGAPKVENKKKALEYLSTVTDVNNQKIVSIERFGLLIKWFGPLVFKTRNIIDKIYELVEEEWFHGEVSRDELKRIDINNNGRKGNFLVRFSQSEPIEKNPFTIVLYTKGPPPLNYHINFDINSGEYSVTFKDKKSNLVEVREKSINGLINYKLKKPLKLGAPVPGVLHNTIFGEMTQVSYTS